MAEHDMLFFEKRSTPKIVKRGESFDAPESYGRRTKRRPATQAEEKQIANGQWVRVDENGNKGGSENYKKTKMKGREHLLKHADPDKLQVVVVALPEDRDRVNKVSSEKGAHLTLLYLGDVTSNSDLASILSYVEHTVSSIKMGSFILDVERRGPLGDDDADVLFFGPGPELRALEHLRSMLLGFEPIKRVYEAQDQYPTWTPHLTLGYPSAPAKRTDDNARFESVRFDRIAVWIEDSEGPEFKLAALPGFAKMGEEFEMVNYAEGTTISHYGVPGMKWGRRKAESRSDFKARTNKERNDFYENKSSTLAKTAAAGGDKVLIKTRYAGDPYGTITTGKEFINELARGRAFDVKVTEVYASQKKAGEQYVLNDNPIGNYKMPKRV